MLNYILEMKDINKAFPGVKALDNVSLNVRPGTVHALMGENGAGKSTLMKCLFGIYNEDSGEILIEGKKTKFSSPKQALENGVAMVHQELNQVLKRDVMENIWLGRFPKLKSGLVDHKIMYRETKKIFDDLDIKVDPRNKLGNLSVSQRQMVEIAKAVSYNSKIIVFDEPTSSLTEIEVKHLFRIINMLKERGCGIIYISHKMEEILTISDDVTIMRDGKWIATSPSQGLTIDMIIKQMVGRELSNRFPQKTNRPGDLILEVNNLEAMYQNVKDVSFTLRKGEILGLAGLVGAGRTEVLETLFGLATKKNGDILVHGKKVKITNPRQAIGAGFALLTEERRATGIFGILPVKDNVTTAKLKKYKKGMFLSEKDMKKDSQWAIDAMRVKTPSYNTKIMSLSGGNQQKVILGRWLLTKPEILLLDEPTRGIDVGAKYEIYQLMINLANEGKGIIMVSSEMPELLGICDRLLVMSGGKVAGEVDAKNTSQEEIMKLAAKYA